jgi:F-type H+-transporting ATPase subunit b
MFGASWVTVLAQFINFIVLLWILDRFLYRPALRLMDERKQKIQDALQAADTARQEGQKMQKEAEGELAGLRLKIEQERSNAAAKVAQTRQEMEAHLEREMRERRQEAESKISSYQAEAMSRLEQDLGQIVLSGIQNAFADIPVSLLDKAMFESFLKHLEPLKTKFHPPVVWLSADPPSEDKRARIQEMLGVPVEARQREDLLMGFRLQGADFELDASLKGHLKRIAEAYKHRLEEPHGTA